MVTHSREYALDDREFELFVEGAKRIPCDLRSLETQFLAFVGGRLGLRPGEICHMTEGWVDWRRRQVDIPHHEPCDKGKDGGICGYCRQNAQQRVEYNSLSIQDARLVVLREEIGPHLPRDIRGKIQAIHRAAVDSELSDEFLQRQLESLLESAPTAQDAETLQQAINETAANYQEENSVTMATARGEMWHGKTENAERAVAFDWNPRTELIIERFFDRFDRFPESFSTIGRRVEEALEYADELDQDATSPHGLRATAASKAAAAGLSPLALRSMFGWSSIATAQSYVSDSDENVRRELHQANSR